MILESLHSSEDIKMLTYEQLESLCAEIRAKIIEVTATNGGHPASNLGCVELTVALHRVFSVPEEPLIFDVGHQSYVHKLLTGRAELFSSLRQFEGISGFQSPAESSADLCCSGHSGSAISFAEGVAAARFARNLPGKVIAVVGDASIANGISLEGLNADTPGRNNLVVVLNDNRMSISKSVGHLAQCLNSVSVGRTYNGIKNFLRNIFSGGEKRARIKQVIRRVEHAIKGAILPHGVFFQNLGFRYIGPVDGHDLRALEGALTSIRKFNEPVLFHVITEKGHGCGYMQKAPTTFHGVSGFEPKSGTLPSAKYGFSKAFGQAMIDMAQKHLNLRAITAAMINGTGLAEFAARFPEQCLDVGIAEEHAVVMAAGMAAAGLRPVCALYATFAQRTLDCIYSDIVLPKQPVIIVMDRAGAVADGPTHHGIYDLGFLRALPGLDILCPRCERMLHLMLECAYEASLPAIIRYPRGCSLPQVQNCMTKEALRRGKAELLVEDEHPQVALWGLGAECGTALIVADDLKKQGISCVVVDPRWLAPFDSDMALRFADIPQVSIEDHSIVGGLGDALALALEGKKHDRLIRFGWPKEIIPHGNVEALKQKYDLTPEVIAAKIAENVKTWQ